MTHGKHRKPHHIHTRQLLAGTMSAAALATGVATVTVMSPSIATASVTLTAHQKHLLHLQNTRHHTVTRTTAYITGLAGYAETFTHGHYYVYGGTGPYGFDCSGLTQYVYRHFGYSIQRTADEQYHQFRWTGAPRPGDLVFFHAGGYSTHTGIYIGGGMMVSALNSYYGIRLTPISWAGGSYSFGTITH